MKTVSPINSIKMLFMAGIISSMLVGCKQLPSEECEDFGADLTSFIEYNKWGGGK